MTSRFVIQLSRVRSFWESNIITVSNKIKILSDPLVKKCEGTVIGRAGTFLKNVAIDYKEVFVETYSNTKANPLKMTIYAGAFGVGAACASLNPDEASFYDELLTNEQRVMLLSDSIRNPLPVEKMTRIETYVNEGRIRRLNLGLMSIMWIDDHDDKTAKYEVQCEFLKPMWDSYVSRIVDIGFCGKWWFLSRSMMDYDINLENLK